MPSLSELEATTLSRPRILCLHGGGTNASILRLQARTYIAALAPHFRLVFADAPFLCAAHPAVLPVYEDMDPFRLWCRWRADQPVCGGGDDEADEAQTCLEEWEYQMQSAMQADDKAGASGDWVGLLGFSQGARVAASMLLESQLRMREQGIPPSAAVEAGPGPVPMGFAGGRWRFAVLMAGRGPCVSLSARGDAVAGLDRLGGLANVAAAPRDAGAAGPGERLALPTVHVHGLADPGLPHMRQLWALDCEPGGAAVVAWDGEHRLAYRTADVEPVVDRILDIARALRLLGDA